jgi:CheY-like chemotaxis protein
LVAEDNPVNQQVVVLILKKAGHSVVLASNGAEAVDASALEPFDLIFMDVQMPVMDGYEATRAIREREEPTNQHTPIVALTAHATKGERETCLQAGMDDYLSKPIRTRELHEMVVRWGGQNVGPDPLPRLTRVDQ